MLRYLFVIDVKCLIINIWIKSSQFYKYMQGTAEQKWWLVSVKISKSKNREQKSENS